MYIILIWVYLAIVKSELDIDDFIMPDYELEESQGSNLKTKILINRRKNRLKNERVRVLDQYLSNNTVYLDGVTHDKIDQLNADIKIINKIENEFRNIIGMKGIKLIYKRDGYWRTWREMKSATGKEIICYKCQNVIRANCSNCHSGGYWTIEEKPPPCTYELFSLKNDDVICVANYTQFKNLKSSCSTLLKFSDLFVNCDNPIVTKYMIQKDYRAVSERYPYVCNWRENCKISTVYVINSEGITFRIVNSSNNIIYSRIMKSGNENYACVNDCGLWNPDTKKVTKDEKSLLLDLLNVKSFKKKRENNKIDNNIGKQTKNRSNIHLLRYEFQNEKKKHRYELKKQRNIKTDNTDPEATTLSHCKRLEKLQEEYQDSETSDYDY